MDNPDYILYKIENLTWSEQAPLWIIEAGGFFNSDNLWVECPFFFHRIMLIDLGISPWWYITNIKGSQCKCKVFCVFTTAESRAKIWQVKLI